MPRKGIWKEKHIRIEEKIEKVEWFDKTQILDIVIPNTYPAILDVINNLN